MEIALLIIGLLLLLGGIGYLVYCLVRRCKIKEPSLPKDAIINFALALGGITLGGALTQWAIQLLNGWGATLPVYRQAMGIAGGGLLMLSIGVFVTTFVFRYYKHGKENPFKKINSIVMFSSIAAIFLSFLLFEEGVALAWEYPLPSGFKIDGQGIGWFYPSSARNSFNVAWYGVLILTGFLVSYFICDHRFYKEFGKHGILENCLIVVFIFGILGARLWYVVGNWNGDTGGITPFSERVAKGDILSIFAFWEGGLTIIGGVIAGIVSGAIYLKLFRKYVPITFALDVVVPAILIAQVIGRWGNFFNHEVYGTETAIANGWWWLPTFIQKEMGIGLEPGNIYVPLFLVEGMINLAGYFLIAHIVPLLWKKKYRAPGALAGVYLIFYGVERMIMEPLRSATYNMGTDGMWSFWNAMGYIIIGVVLIILLSLYEFVWRKKRALAKEAAGEGASETVSAETIEAGNADNSPMKDPEPTIEKDEVKSAPQEDKPVEFVVVHKKKDE